jgi:hypothetical protein
MEILKGDIFELKGNPLLVSKKLEIIIIEKNLVTIMEIFWNLSRKSIPLKNR